MVNDPDWIPTLNLGNGSKSKVLFGPQNTLLNKGVRLLMAEAGEGDHNTINVIVFAC